jgi:citrate lyase subunit beta/citryl-CoA lyase
MRALLQALPIRRFIPQNEGLRAVAAPESQNGKNVNMSPFTPLIAPLFVPATRTDRIAKAAQSGADAIIVDLEDAVPAPEKTAARDGLAQWFNAAPDPAAVPIFVRINAVGSVWFDDDLALLRSVPVAGIMLPKAERAADIAAVGPDLPVIGLIETAAGLVSLPEICGAPNLRQLAFGSIDYALDLGCSESREALLLARLSIVTQSRAQGLPSPVDGVTVSVTDVDVIRSDAEYARGLGFGGKLAIHPSQIAIIKTALRPSEADLTWARTICRLDDARSGATVLLDGCMIDTPVIAKARQILVRAGAVDG